jgi:hypothetical protein
MDALMNEELFNHFFEKTRAMIYSKLDVILENHEFLKYLIKRVIKVYPVMKLANMLTTVLKKDKKLVMKEIKEI